LLKLRNATVRGKLSLKRKGPRGGRGKVPGGEFLSVEKCLGRGFKKRGEGLPEREGTSEMERGLERYVPGDVGSFQE